MPVTNSASFVVTCNTVCKHKMQSFHCGDTAHFIVLTKSKVAEHILNVDCCPTLPQNFFLLLPMYGAAHLILTFERFLFVCFAFSVIQHAVLVFLNTGLNPWHHFLHILIIVFVDSKHYFASMQN